MRTTNTNMKIWELQIQICEYMWICELANYKYKYVNIYNIWTTFEQYLNVSPTQGQYNLSLAGNNWTYFQIHTTNYISNFIGVSLRSTTSTTCAVASRWSAGPQYSNVSTCHLRAVSGPAYTSYTLSTTLPDYVDKNFNNKHTYRHKFSLICRQERECLYIGRT